jgi:hypothetical protein
MIDLDDTERFIKLVDISMDWVCSYSNTNPPDRERREQYREAAIAQGAIRRVPNALWWAVRIEIVKAGRMLDIDNVPKVAIDAFCAHQVARDRSEYLETGIYPDDTIDFVRELQVSGRPGSESKTHVEVFACVAEHTA